MNTPKPYGRLKMLTQYISYKRNAVTRHDIHSPFVFEMVEEVFRKTSKAKNSKIETERERLEKSIQVIDFVDYGKNGTSVRKEVSDIAKKSLKSKKYARLLGRICDFYNVKNVVELGTSLGITTAYLAENSDNVTTLEGSTEVSKIAESIWGYLGLDNIKLITGDFESTLDRIPNEELDLVYIDGNHRSQPTLRYFNNLLAKSHDKTIFIFDDINWSADMQLAWKQVKEHPRVQVTIDLFALGIVLINQN